MSSDDHRLPTRVYNSLKITIHQGYYYDITTYLPKL